MFNMSDVFVKINAELFGASYDEIDKCPNIPIFIVELQLFYVLLMLGPFYENFMTDLILS